MKNIKKELTNNLHISQSNTRQPMSANSQDMKFEATLTRFDYKNLKAHKRECLKKLIHISLMISYPEKTYPL